MARQTTQSRPPQGLQVIHAGLWRTGTMSIAGAYERLGYSVHHVSTTNPTKTPWVFVEHAAEATWPSVPGVKPGRPLPTRAEWDATWGQYDILTDLVSPFVPELIALYPEAKVVIVQRNFEAWWKSMQDTILPTFLDEPRTSVERLLASALFGIRGGHAMRIALLGFFGVKRKADITKEIARAKFDAYYSRVRAMVPPERRLEYRLGDGWEPLCDFLGKDVPVEPFPRLNDTQGFYINKKKSGDQVIGTKLVESLPWMVGGLALVAAWMLYRYSSMATGS